MGAGDLCFFCERQPANPNLPLRMRLDNTGQDAFIRGAPLQNVTVSIPTCRACSGKKANTALLMGVALLGLAIFAGISVGWQGALGTLGLGAFALMIVQGLVTGSTKAREYPAVKELERQGWRIVGGPE